MVIVAGVLSSFGLNLFGGERPEIILPVPTPSASAEPPGTVGGGTGGFVQVSVTPETVQSVIESLPHQASYSRVMTFELYSGGELATTATARVWVDGEWTRVDYEQPVQPSGVQHTIVGGGEVHRWYGSQRAVEQWPADANSVYYEGQHLPTYQDVLDLDKGDIVSAEYQQKENVPCVYVAARDGELGYELRYWISVNSGLLVCAEAEDEGLLLWRTSSYTWDSLYAAEASGSLDALFQLPGGEQLHRVGVESETE